MMKKATQVRGEGSQTAPLPQSKMAQRRAIEAMRQNDSPTWKLESSIKRVSALLKLTGEKMTEEMESESMDIGGIYACGLQELCWTATCALWDSFEAVCEEMRTLRVAQERSATK